MKALKLGEKPWFPSEDGQDSGGPFYRKTTVNKWIVKAILTTNNYLQNRGRLMTKDLDKFLEIIDQAENKYSIAIDKFNETEKTLRESSKKSMAIIRSLTNETADSINKIDSKIDIHKFSKQVDLLERATIAIEKLYEIELSGKLNKIINAITIEEKHEHK